MAKTVQEQLAAAKEAYDAQVKKLADGLIDEHTAAIEALRDIRRTMSSAGLPLPLLPADLVPAKSSGGGSRTRGGPGGNVDKETGKAIPVAQVVLNVIAANKGKASTSQIRKAFEEAGDERGFNLSALAAAGIINKVGEEEKAEGQKGRAPGIYAAGDKAESAGKGKGKKKKG